MSQVRKVKGVSPNYMQFLWISIGKIRQAQSEGDFAQALNLSVTLIDFLPDEFRNEFGERANQIMNSINLIVSGKIKYIQEIDDLFMRSIAKDKLLSTYSKKALSHFITTLSTKLDAKGYFEIRSNIPEGWSHTLNPDDYERT